MAVPDVKPIPAAQPGHTGIWAQKNFDDFAEALKSKHTCCHSAFQELSDNARAVGRDWNATQLHIDLKPEHAWGTGQLEICTLLENGRGMSGPELENLFHLGHARKHRERIDIDNAIYAHFGIGEIAALENLSSDTFVFTDNGKQWSVARYGTILNDEMCRMDLKGVAGGLAFAMLTFQRGSMSERGLDWSQFDEETTNKAIKAMTKCRSPFKDIDQLLIPFKAFKEHFGSNATGVLTAIVAPRMDGNAPVIRGGPGFQSDGSVRDIIQASGDVRGFENSKFLRIFLQRAYLPAGRQGLFPLADAGDLPDMRPSEQVITVSGYRVETDEHPWAQAVLTDGMTPSPVLSVSVEDGRPCAWTQFCYQGATKMTRNKFHAARMSDLFFFRRDRALLKATDAQRREDLATIHRLLQAKSTHNPRMLEETYALFLRVCGRDEDDEFDFMTRKQWGKLASGDKAHAYALTGAGVVGIVRVDCLEQDEPKESFRDSALRRKLYDAVYECMLRYIAANPPLDGTAEIRAQREAEKRVLAEARREKAASLKRAASAIERKQAEEAAAAAAEPAARAANGRSAAPGKGGGRGHTRTPSTPELDSGDDDDDGDEESDSEDDVPISARKRKALDCEPTFTETGRRPVKKPAVYNPSRVAGMGLAPGKPPSRPGSNPPQRCAATANGAAERSPTPARRGSAGRELATVPADDGWLSEIASLADSFPESPALWQSRLDKARRAGISEANKCVKQQQMEYNAFKKRFFALAQQLGSLGSPQPSVSRSAMYE